MKLHKNELKKLTKKLFLLLLPLLVFANCGDFSLFNQLSQPVSIVVYNADQNNNNKTSPKKAVDLWAVSTRYETGGYSSEKVQLTDKGNGEWSGLLPLVDQGDTYIIIYDDVQTKPIPYGNSTLQTSTFYFSASKRLITDDYFSPCMGPVKNPTGANTPLYNLMSSGQISIFNNADNVGSATTANDEVYIVQYVNSDSSTVQVDYTQFGQANVSWFCNCNRNVQIYKTSIFYSSPSTTVTNTYPYSTPYVMFTDNDHFTPSMGTGGYTSTYTPPYTTVVGGTTCPSR
ncbi:MAG: hypothetical protein ABUK01_01280 [Leptospirales bacterium]